jgi:hypothetical protein
MTPEQFAYWLQGYTELTAGQQPTPEQWQSITEHLKTVFVKVTPPVESAPRTVAPMSIEEAMRRFNESQQRAPTPYGPRDPYWGQIQVTC